MIMKLVRRPSIQDQMHLLGELDLSAIGPPGPFDWVDIRLRDEWHSDFRSRIIAKTHDRSSVPDVLCYPVGWFVWTKAEQYGWAWLSLNCYLATSLGGDLFTVSARRTFLCQWRLLRLRPKQ